MAACFLPWICEHFIRQKKRKVLDLKSMCCFKNVVTLWSVSCTEPRGPSATPRIAISKSSATVRASSEPVYTGSQSPAAPCPYHTAAPAPGTGGSPCRKDGKATETATISACPSAETSATSTAEVSKVFIVGVYTVGGGWEGKLHWTGHFYHDYFNSCY